MAMQQSEWDERGLRRVFRPHSDRLAAQVLDSFDTALSLRNQVGDTVTIGVAHGDCPARVARLALGIEPGQG